MKVRQVIVYGILLLALSPGLLSVRGSKGTAVVRSGKDASLKLDLRRLPLSFEANAGQISGPAEFLARGRGYALYIEPSGAVLEFGRPDSATTAMLRMTLEGANTSPRLTGEDKQTGVSHYFIGSDPGGWKTKIPHYAKVRASEVYPGVDLVYYGNPQELEFDLVVTPGADPSRIVLALDAARKIEIDGRGDLIVDLGNGNVRLRHPNVYQGTKDLQESVEGAFILLGPSRVGFDVSSYDRTRPLVIDPAIVYATYFGSGGWEMIENIAVDNFGCLYVLGSTQEPNFPTVNALNPTYRGGIFDVFVSKLNAAGDTLLFSTYFGGSGRDTGGGIAVDADGDIYLAGVTDSANFPLVSPLQSTFGGNGSVGFGDAFLTKMKSDGSALIYSTYLGGNGDDLAMRVAVDADKNAYVTGVTESANFPTANAFQAHYHGNQDAFISKVNAAGSVFVFSTYLGGTGTEASQGFGGQENIAVTPDGHVIVAGCTNSADFPVVNAFQTTYAGGGYLGDGVVTMFDPSGQSVVFSTYLGGVNEDEINSVATNESGTVFVTGVTRSSNFPTHNAYQGSFGGGEKDAFVCAFSSDGTALYSTYLGGSGNDEGQDSAVNALGNCYVVGSTQSPNFPAVNPIQGVYSGAGDAFVTVFAADGASLGFSTFLGGSGGANAKAVGLDPEGNIYLAGGAGANFPTTPNSLMPNPPVSSGGLFMAKIEGVALVPGPGLTSLLPSSASAGDPGFTLVVEGSDFVDGAVLRWDGKNRTTTFVSSSRLEAAIEASDLVAGKNVMVTVRNPDTGVSNALAFTISNPAPSLGAIAPISITGGGAAFTLTVTGSSFVPNSVVRWNGNARATTYVSATELQAAIPATDLATAGEVQVTVANPAPAGGTSTAAVFSVAGYGVAPSPSSVTVTAGQSATYTIQLTPQFGSFDSSVSFSCVGLPSKCTATFSPTTVTPGASAATTMLTLATQASSGSGSALSLGVADFGPPAMGLIAVLFLILLAGLHKHAPWRLTRRWLAAGALVCFIIVIGNCSSGGGGGNNPPAYTGTPRGTHTITVQAVAGTLRITTPITLVVN